MLSIGLTGGMGAGKSTAARVLAARGAAIVDADAIAREIVAPGQPALTALAEAFGEQILTADGSLDRPALAAAAFSSPEATATLNGIMHPAIGARTDELVAAAEADGAEVCVYDVPLLVENGLSERYHLAILVDLDPETRLDRLVAGRGVDREDAARRIAAQATDAQRYAACDVRLPNTGTPEDLERLVGELWESRISPFAENLAGARCAVPAGGSDALTAPHAAERIRARIARACADAGLSPEISLRIDSGLVVGEIRAEAGSAEEIGAALDGLGLVACDDGGVRGSADPGQPVRLTLA